ASKVYIDDLTEEFVRDYVFPAFRANAIYENRYLLGTSLARPVIAKRLVEIARQEGAEAVAHGATGKGNDQVRFELSVQALAPDLMNIAPWRLWDLNSRSALIDFADKHGIPVPVTKKKLYSVDRNLLHISFEGGMLEDPWTEPPRETYVLAVPPEEAPDEPRYVEISFENGDPVAVDGQRLSPAALLQKLNEIGGAHGVGRVGMVENRYVGMKSRGVYETPGGALIRAAHMGLESITLDREVVHLRDGLIPRYAEMIYYGYWFAPEREALQALIDKSQENVWGDARLKLYKGHISLVGRRSDRSLYQEALCTFEADDVYDQSLADGFIKLSGLRLRLKALTGR
ncbi:MAG: argininosuccinate synthase, partial [Deltaproteobacteria bacterium]|nr:argininosuccinate synthase [Deltaproteobacteria bacterium]